MRSGIVKAGAASALVAAALGLGPGIGVRAALAGSRAWEAPAVAGERYNPLPRTEGAVAAGKAIYAGSCAMCHGPRGRGDGPAAVALDPRPRPFSDPRVAGQPDGALFWKISTGRPPMPSWKGGLTEEERWTVIHYLRTLMGPARKEGGKR